jgi:hypothetical protein
MHNANECGICCLIHIFNIGFFPLGRTYWKVGMGDIVFGNRLVVTSLVKF